MKTKGLVLFLSIVMVFSSFGLGYATDQPENEVDNVVSNMTLEEKIGQMIMPSLRIWDNVTEANSEIESTIKKYNLGGIILFAENIKDPNQTYKLVNNLQNSSEDIPLLVSIDQEGGIVNRIDYGTKFPGNMALGATGSEKYAYRVGKTIGEELKALGINVNFGPVLDVNVNPDNPVIGVRSFGGDANLVSDLGASYIKGLHDEGVAATGKHFPGHGDTAIDSHIGLPMVPHDMERLEAVELKPFQRAIDEGVDMIMTAHVVFPAIDDTMVESKIKNDDGTYKKVPLPATLSSKVLTGLMREKMGFEGVIVTDALEMKAITDNFGKEESVIRAVKAGSDIALIPTDLDAAYNSLIKAVEDGEISEDRIDDSVRRIIKLKVDRGIYNPLGETNKIASKGKNKDLEKIVGSNNHKALERVVAQKATTLVKNENDILPFKLEDGKKIVLLAPWENRLDIMKESLETLLTEKGIEGVEISGFSYSNIESLTLEQKEAIDSSDYTILGSYSWNVTSRTPGEYWAPSFALDVVNYTNQKNKSLAVMAIRNPYDIMYMPDVKGYIAIYGRADGPNIPAGINVIFGEAEPLGKLPVNIPNMDGTDILYEMGYGLSY